MQFVHRVRGAATLAGALSRRRHPAERPCRPRARAAVLRVPLMAVAQFALGVSTLVLTVPVPVAAAHQAGALALLTAMIWALGELRAPQPAAGRTPVRAELSPTGACRGRLRPEGVRWLRPPAARGSRGRRSHRGRAARAEGPRSARHAPPPAGRGSARPAPPQRRDRPEASTAGRGSRRRDRRRWRGSGRSRTCCALSPRPRGGAPHGLLAAREERRRLGGEAVAAHRLQSAHAAVPHQVPQPVRGVVGGAPAGVDPAHGTVIDRRARRGKAAWRSLSPRAARARPSGPPGPGTRGSPRAARRASHAASEERSSSPSQWTATCLRRSSAGRSPASTGCRPTRAATQDTSRSTPRRRGGARRSPRCRQPRAPRRRTVSNRSSSEPRAAPGSASLRRWRRSSVPPEADVTDRRAAA